MHKWSKEEQQFIKDLTAWAVAEFAKQYVHGDGEGI
jgi:hypothetical protein